MTVFKMTAAQTKTSAVRTRCEENLRGESPPFFAASSPLGTRGYGQHTNEGADERERKGKKKTKVVVLCNTRHEERWKDEAGRVLGVGVGSEGSPQDSCTII